MRTPKKVTVIGYGSWGTAIARLVGRNAIKYPRYFDSIVNFWVSEKVIEGEKYCDIMNRTHENPKYLPGKKLPPNVVAIPNLVDACRGSNILLFVVPHQGIQNVLEKLEGKINPKTTIGVSLIKGISKDSEGELKLISEEIEERLHIETSVLMGANLAHEVAEDKFCEATIGSNTSQENAAFLERLFTSDNFKVNVVPDAPTVELCGALKNIVACAAGFADGLKSGDNTKAAVIRLGLMEMTKFVEYFYPGARISTFLESCGVADLVTSCYGGRNRKVCEAFVHAKKPLQVVEEELLHGQSAQGPLTAKEVYALLERTGISDRFPIFSAVHKICEGKMPPGDLIRCLQNHPEHARRDVQRFY